ncbi:umecyanin-like [Neltuma alba]|uniref:umecyanin-like n=1 Tax=Neltuma alba TaxID=207710 RepID=UPI0010A4FCBC|nr:umecyanin-like [Prosopis alba]
MAKLANMAILFVAAFAAIFLPGTEAEDFTVGGSTGWTNNPSGGASFYSNWASDLTFNVNDVLVFNFATGRHDVAILTKDNFDNCNVNNPIQLINNGPARVTLNRTGDFHFACGFPGHCNSGQKLSINVSGSSSPTSPPSVPGAPGSSPPGETPPESSATSLAITFSLLLATSCLNLFLHF